MNLDKLPAFDLATGTLMMPLWAVGVLAALAVALVVIAVLRAGLHEFGGLVFRVAILVIAIVFGWTYVNRASDRDRADERRALDQRAADLTGRAITPGSAIACLEASSTETIEGACERAVFASPETVAAATAYVSARLTLLADAHEYTARRDQSYETSIAGIRRTIAADRYGLASQVLALRDGCTPEACDAFGLVYDDKKLRADLKDRLFDATVARYAVNWPTRTRPIASATPSSGSVTPPGPNVTFPSADSIPPVSIMNSEPTAQQAAAPPPASESAPAAPAPDARPAAAAEPRPTNTAPASASRRPPRRSSSTGSSPAPLSLNPGAKQ